MTRVFLLGLVLLLVGCLGSSPSDLDQDPFACEFLKFPPSKELVFPEKLKIILVFVPLSQIIEKKGPNARAVTFNFSGTIVIWLPAGRVSKELMCLAWHEGQHGVEIIEGVESWHP